MRSTVLGSLSDDMKTFVETHEGLAAYKKANGETAAHRFWNLLRSDLMRCSPGKVAEYLRNTDSKLADAGSFGDELASRYFDGEEEGDQRIHQEVLIYACLEMDAAWRLSRLGADETLKQSLQSLQKKLKIWRTPS